MKVPDEARNKLALHLRRFAAAMNVEASQPNIDIAVELVHRASQGNSRSCHPRDVLQLIIEESRFVKRPPVLEPAATRRACEVYFAIDPGPVSSLPSQQPRPETQS